MFTNGEKYLAVHRLLDSVWSLTFEFQADRVKVLSYSRDNPDGYELERQVPQVKIIEDNNRNVLAIKIYEPKNSFDCFNEKFLIDEYKVVNPQFVFSYKG